MALYDGNTIRVKEKKEINPLYRGMKGTVVKWLHGNNYIVSVLGTELILSEDDMTEEGD